MSKLKSPVLSLGAQGTIADALTFQKRGQDTIVREKPIPTDPYSLAQAYQRWDYKDYAYLWTLLTNAQKQVYRTRASRYHITGFSLWMKEHLRDLTGIVARWHMDEATGSFVADSSHNNIHATSIGATPVPGVISNARYFDGLNDTVACGINPLLRPTSYVTHEFFVKLDKLSQSCVLFCQGILPTEKRLAIGLYVTKDDILLGTATNKTGLNGIAAHLTTNVQHWCHLWDLTTNTITFFLDGVEQTLVATPDYFSYDPSNRFWLGARENSMWVPGIIDNFTIYDYLLPETLIKRHSKRRYPVQ